MVALTAYPVLAGRKDLMELGGAQVQQVMIARALVRAGIRVTFVCMDFGQPEEETIDGIRVVRAFAPGAGMRGLRFFHPRWTGLRRALARADADVYYQRCSGVTTGLLAHWCRQNHRPMIYAGASDPDFEPGPPNIPGRRDQIIYTYGLRAADAIVAQNPTQVQLVREHHGREATLIPSCYVRPDYPAGPSAPASEVLWVGMIRQVKRPDRFLDLVQALPQVRFRMIGGPMGDSPEVLAYYRQIEARARTLPNLEFMGFVPFAEVDPWFDKAAILVNTSDAEGFPNTFLQAWSRQVPSVAFFDSGSRVEGRVPYALVKGDAEMAAAVENLMTNEAARRELGAVGQRFFQEQHSPERTVERYRDLLIGLTHRAYR